MPEPKQNTSQDLIRIIFMMLFSFVLFSGVTKAEKPIHNTNQHFFITETHTCNSHAIIVDSFQQINFQVKLFITLDVSGFTFRNFKFKIKAENRIISQALNAFQKKLTCIQVLSCCRFYYHFFHIDSKNTPALS